MKLLLIGDVAHTGFGRVTREIGAGLLARGYDVKIIGINHRGIDGEVIAALRKGPDGIAQARTYLDGIEADPLYDRILPANIAGHGMGHNLSLPAIQGELWKGWVPNAVVVVADPRAMWWRLTEDGGAFAVAKKRGIPAYNYVPVEGVGIPASWRLIYQHVRPVAMSEFGQAQLEALLGEPVPLVPHGVSPAFRPVTSTDMGSWRGTNIPTKATAKAALGLAGKTVVLRVDRYIYRKNYPAFFRVMRPILAERDDVVTLVHSVPVDDDGRGTIWDLISREPGATTGPIFEGLGQVAATYVHPQIMLTGAHDSFKGLSDDELRVLYNAADLMVSPTMSEGFGLCLAESLACEVPVVATDYSAIPEVVGPGGALIPISGYVTNAYAHEWALVDEPAMTEAVRRLLADPAERRRLGRAGRQHVARYTWSAAVEAFDRLLSPPVAAAA